MNFLMVSEASWNTQNSFGNTISNLFEGEIWNNCKFFHFYTRKQFPNSANDVSYYNLSAFDILRSGITPVKGNRFPENSVSAKSVDSESRLITRIHSKDNELIHFMYECVWRYSKKKWLGKDFRDYIENASIDVVFAFADTVFILKPIIEFMKKNSKAKVVLFIVDDVYDGYSNAGWLRRLLLRKDYEYCINNADKVYAISKSLKKEYAKQFNIDIGLLTKGVQIEEYKTNDYRPPYKIVYAGNLLWGRIDVLLELARSLKRINAQEPKFFLEIYSGTKFADGKEKLLNIAGTSMFMGQSSYEEVKENMKKAHFVLHVESFEEKYQKLVRYSFSTKIIDCFQSGSIPIAIGPSGIESIEYLKEVPGTIVINSLDDIEKVLGRFDLRQYGLGESLNNIRKFTSENLDINKIQKQLHNDLKALSNNKKALIVATVGRFLNFELNDIKIMQNLGYEVHCATNRALPEDNFEIDGVIFHEILFERSPFKKANIEALKALKELIEKESFDLVHCHTPVAGILTRLVARKYRRKTNLKVIYTAHGFHFYTGAPIANWLLFYPAEWICAWFTDVLILINDEDYNRALKHMHASKVVKIPGVGLDIDKIMDNSSARDDVREILGVKEDEILILSVGELNANKNHIAIVNAMQNLDDKYKYYICGAGPNEKNLLEMINSLGLNDRVKLLGYRNDVIDICKAADIYAYPSRREGLGMSALEAMASGLPLVASNIHGIKDYLIEGETGFGGNPNDSDSFVSAIKKLEDKALRNKIGFYNKKYVNKFSVQETEKIMQMVYKEISQN